MPVIPRFTISQNDTSIILVVHLPYIRITNLEFSIDENTLLSLYCQPYLLKLQLPGKIRNDEEEQVINNSNNNQEYTHAAYDPNKDNGTLTLTLTKYTPGEYFENLDMITRLLIPNSSLKENFPSQPSQDIIQQQQNQQHKNTSSSSSSSILQPSTERLDGSDASFTSSSTTKSTTTATPLIEVLDSQNFPTTTTTEEEENKVLASLSIPSVYTDSSLLNITKTNKISYGFHRLYKLVFMDLKEEITSTILQIPDPDNIPNSLRPLLRIAAENNNWDPERYIGDYLDGNDDPIYQEAIQCTPFWLQYNKPTISTSDWIWTNDEMQILTSLPNKEYMIDNFLVGGKYRITDNNTNNPTSTSNSDKTSSSTIPDYTQYLKTVNSDTCPPETNRLLLGLITILISYCYDYRLTNGEHNVESSWTITTLSPLLSWLDDEYIIQNPNILSNVLPSDTTTDDNNNKEESLTMLFNKLNLSIDNPASSSSSSSTSTTIIQPTIGHAVVACIRRCLLYPYLRRIDLALLAIMDTATIFFHGPKIILKCLLKIHSLFSHEESRYLFNTLYINDYCIWIQSIPIELLIQYGNNLSYISTNYRTAISTINDNTTTADSNTTSASTTTTNNNTTLSPSSLLSIIYEGLQAWKLYTIEQRASNGEDIYSTNDEESDEDTEDTDTSDDDDDEEDTSTSAQESEEDHRAEAPKKPLIEEIN